MAVDLCCKRRATDLCGTHHSSLSLPGSTGNIPLFMCVKAFVNMILVKHNKFKLPFGELFMALRISVTYNAQARLRIPSFQNNSVEGIFDLLLNDSDVCRK